MSRFPKLAGPADGNRSVSQVGGAQINSQAAGARPRRACPLRCRPRRARRAGLFLVLGLLMAFWSLAGCQPEPVVVDPPPPQPPPPPMVPCPLCGKLLPPGTDVSMRPVVVVIDNHPSSRPQAGLEDACVVFEVLAEGGITRLMPVYVHGKPERLGPVRSVRHYMFDLALGLDGLLSHAGGSPQALDEVRTLGVASLNAFGLDSFYWRVSERRMPHNLYTSIQSLLGATAKKGFRSTREPGGTRWPYLSGKTLDAGLPACPGVEIVWPFNTEGYKVTFRWRPGASDGEPGRYERAVNGQTQIDEGSGATLGGRNVVIAFARFWRIPRDPEGRLDADLTGEGRALVFSDGRQTEVRWRKSERSTPFVLVGQDGRPVELPPGQTWIAIVPEQTEVRLLTQ